jgi:hypothetical protein
MSDTAWDTPLAAHRMPLRVVLLGLGAGLITTPGVFVMVTVVNGRVAKPALVGIYGLVLVGVTTGFLVLSEEAAKRVRASRRWPVLMTVGTLGPLIVMGVYSWLEALRHGERPLFAAERLLDRMSWLLERPGLGLIVLAVGALLGIVLGGPRLGLFFSAPRGAPLSAFKASALAAVLGAPLCLAMLAASGSVTFYLALATGLAFLVPWGLALGERVEVWLVRRWEARRERHA